MAKCMYEPTLAYSVKERADESYRQMHKAFRAGKQWTLCTKLDCAVLTTDCIKLQAYRQQKQK